MLPKTVTTPTPISQVVYGDKTKKCLLPRGSKPQGWQGFQDLMGSPFRFRQG